MNVAVVIVSRDTRDATLRCVASVLADAAACDARVVVVDNASSDGTADAVRERFGARVRVLANAANTGFGAACNQGAAAEPDTGAVLFLNADVELLDGALPTLVAALRDRGDAAACGPAIVGADGAPQPSVRGHPSRLALLHQHTALRFLRVGAAAYRRYKDPAVPQRTGDVDVVMGACLLVRRDDLRAGGFDERYFLYFEEADLQRRFAERGRRVLFVPEAVVRHAGGASSRRDPERALTWYVESLFRYVDRWHGRPAGLAFRAAFKPLFAIRLVTDAVRDAAALVFRGRRAKVAELKLAAKFAARGFWRVMFVA